MIAVFSDDNDDDGDDDDDDGGGLLNLLKRKISRCGAGAGEG